jgi:hypothetical protein
MPSWQPARSASDLRHGAQRVLFESCSATAAFSSTLTAEEVIIDWPASSRRVIRDLPASAIARSPADQPPGFSYGTTELTEVPQFALPSLVPPQVGMVRVNSDPTQFGYWM